MTEAAASSTEVVEVPRAHMRLLVWQDDQSWVGPAAGLVAWLRPGDVVVVNDAATLPASLLGEDAHGAPVELRLAGPPLDGRASAVLFGDGDARLRTEDRPPPPLVTVGARLSFPRGGPARLWATVRAVSPLSPRLVDVELSAEGQSASAWSALYALGKPVQYAHRPTPLPLWDVQTSYAARPWAVEMPSAGRSLTFATLATLRHQGVAVCALTHAAGLSATGDPALDAALPLAERYEIPASTAVAIAQARARGGRVVAVGTSVVRALESAVDATGHVRPGRALTELVLDATHALRVVDGLLTGVHAPGESHYRLLAAFLDEPALERLRLAAQAARLVPHEAGDACLLFAAAQRRGAVDGSASSRISR